MPTEAGCVRRGEGLRVIIVERSASTTSLQPPHFSFRFNFLSRKPLLQSQRNQRTTPTSTTTKRQNPFASDCLNSPRKQEVTRSSTNLNTGSKSSSPTALGPLLQSSIFRELVQKNSNFSEDDSTDGEEPKNQPQVGSDDEYSGIFYEGTGDNPFVCSSTAAVDDAFATQPASEAFSPPSIYAESNGQGFDGGFGGSDDPILPAPSEMLPEEGFALREWRSQDFVMYVGGPVWALDWCPRVHQSSDGHPKCENTYESIESETLAELNEGKVLRKLPSVISIGPLAPCFFETSQQLQWLNDQATGSVLYVSFGSRTAMSREQIRELGDGLVRSGCRFLWAVKDKKVDIEDDEKLTEVLGEELLERVKKNGLAVKNWLNQEEILSHPVIGGFLSHCGWNSLSETLWNGVCVLAWPQHGNQKVNADLVERIGLRTWDKSWGWGDGEMLVKAEDIAQRVSEIMGNDLLKLHALHIRDNARRAVGDGGSSTESHCSHQHMEEVSGSTIVKPSFPRSD